MDRDRQAEHSGSRLSHLSFRVRQNWQAAFERWRSFFSVGWAWEDMFLNGFGGGGRRRAVLHKPREEKRSVEEILQRAGALDWLAWHRRSIIILSAKRIPSTGNRSRTFGSLGALSFTFLPQYIRMPKSCPVIVCSKHHTVIQSSSSKPLQYAYISIGTTPFSTILPPSYPFLPLYQISRGPGPKANSGSFGLQNSSGKSRGKKRLAIPVPNLTG